MLRITGRRIAEVLGWTVALDVLWIATLTAVNAAELVVATVCSLACAVLGTATRTTLGTALRPRAGWARWLLRLPLDVVADLGRLTVAVARARRTGGTLGAVRTLPLPPDDRDRAETRRAVGAVVVSLTPGSYVVDVDDSGLVLHALTSTPSALERAVGGSS